MRFKYQQLRGVAFVLAVGFGTVLAEREAVGETVNGTATQPARLKDTTAKVGVLNATDDVREAAGKGRSTPNELRRIVLRARSLAAKGQTKEAASLYLRVIRQYPQHKVAVLLARRKLVWILGETQPVDYEVIGRHLTALISESRQADQGLLNYGLRLLFRRVIEAEPRQRARIWTKGLKGLSAGGLCLEKETLEQLPLLVESLGTDHELSAAKVLTDMVLLAPDLQSVRKLQQRRIEILERKGAWDEATAAANLDIVLASTTSEGPSEAVKRCLNVMQRAGRPASEREAFVGFLFWGTSGSAGGSGAGPAPSKIWNRHIDSSLRLAAAEALKDETRNLSSRRRAFLNLFAGNTKEALKCAHASLSDSPTTRRKLTGAFNDLSVVAAISDGGPFASSAFLEWLAAGMPEENPKPALRKNAEGSSLGILKECETRLVKANVSTGASLNSSGARTYGKLTGFGRKEAIRDVRAVFRNRAVECGAEAFRTGDLRMASGFWFLAIEESRDSLPVVSLIETALDRQEGTGKAKKLRKAMKMMLPYLSSVTSRGHVIAKIGVLSYEEGDFRECLAMLDQADALVGKERRSRDMSTGLIRAMALIRLSEFDKVVSLLRDIEKWQGGREERAKAVFLLGWIHLQRNKKPEALLFLRRVLDRYAGTSIAGKARKLVARLEGF